MTKMASPLKAYGPGRRKVLSQGFNMTTKVWRIVYTHPRAEFTAATTIPTVTSIDTYCPWETVSGESGKRVKPLLPGTVFVKCEHERIGDVRKVDSVKDFHRLPGGKVWGAPEGVIEDFQRMQQQGAFDQTTDRRYKDGDKVRITERPYERLVGKVMSARAKDRVQILLDSVNKVVTVSTKKIAPENS
jgi:transcription antitermination factor NusG